MGRVFGVGYPAKSLANTMRIESFSTPPSPWRPPGFAVLIVISALIGAVWIVWSARPANANAATTSVSSTLQLR